jgi:hypothetical protein
MTYGRGECLHGTIVGELLVFRWSRRLGFRLRIWLWLWLGGGLLLFGLFRILGRRVIATTSRKKQKCATPNQM